MADALCFFVRKRLLRGRAVGSASTPSLQATLHGSQGKTEFATYLSGLPERNWDTPVAKFTLYNDNHRVADLRQYGPPVAMRKAMFARHKLDLQANDLLNAFTGLDTGNEACNYLTPCHNPLNTWAQHLTPDSSFYSDCFSLKCIRETSSLPSIHRGRPVPKLVGRCAAVQAILALE